MLLDLKYQGSTAEESALQKPHQGSVHGCAEYHPCLNFFGYFLFSRKESDRNISYSREKNVKNKIKTKCL